MDTWRLIPEQLPTWALLAPGLALLDSSIPLGEQFLNNGIISQPVPTAICAGIHLPPQSLRTKPGENNCLTFQEVTSRAWVNQVSILPQKEQDSVPALEWSSV